MRRLISVITSILLVFATFTSCVDSTKSNAYNCLPDKAVYEITREIDFIDGKSLPHSHIFFFVKTTLWKNKENITDAFNSCSSLKEVRVVLDDLNAEPSYDRFGNITKKASKTIYRVAKPSVKMLSKYQSLDAFSDDYKNFTFRNQYITEGQYKGEKVIEFVINPE